MKFPNLTLEEVKTLPWDRLNCIVVGEDVIQGIYIKISLKEYTYPSYKTVEGYVNTWPVLPDEYEHLYFMEALGSYKRKYQYLLNMLGLAPSIGFPHVIRGWVRPDLWREYLEKSAGKKEREKRGILLAITGTAGLLAKDGLTGELLLKANSNREWVNGKRIYYSSLNRHLLDDMYYDGSQYWERNGHEYVINGNAIPFAAIVATYEECSECGLIHNKDDCPVCSRKYIIREYHARAEAVFPFKDDGEKHPEYMGIELEYEDCRDQVKPVLLALKDHAIIKRDGSILNGFEITTAPATLAAHKKAFSGFFGKVKVVVKSNCGMHVHFGKKHLTEMQKGKLLAFLYKKENIPIISSLAGRQYASNHYCKAEIERKVTDGVYSRTNIRDKECRRSPGKYEALNTSPQTTVEFRIFAPPKDEYTLFYRLEFVQAMVDWTKPGICSVKDVTDWQKFTAFVASYKKFYPNLWKEIA